MTLNKEQQQIINETIEAVRTGKKTLGQIARELRERQNK